MVIFRENKRILEGIWALPPAGKELILAKNYSAQIDALRKELYGIFGDDICSDSLGDAKNRIWKLATIAFVQNTAKSLYPKGQRLNREDSLSVAIQVLGKTNKVFGTEIMDKNDILTLAGQFNGWTR